MPQYPLSPSVGGNASALNLTAATVVKASPGVCYTISVIVAGTTPGTANDVTTTGAAAVANQFFEIPNTVGSYTLKWPCASAITIVPGTGQTVSVAYA